MDWKEAVNEARSELGYSEGEYIQDWDSVVKLAKDLIEEDKEENFEEYQEQKKENILKYQDRLNSEEWKILRNAKLESENYICRDCGGKATEVHHKRYVNIGTPWEWYELVCLCRDCHHKRHHGGMI